MNIYGHQKPLSIPEPMAATDVESLPRYSHPPFSFYNVSLRIDLAKVLVTRCTLQNATA
jgi:hypothetical protein